MKQAPPLGSVDAPADRPAPTFQQNNPVRIWTQLVPLMIGDHHV